eukprot:CCRYP_017478-RA/>CCRYP_017478-RA protein AED:0.04 eAED:0.04 QI:169/1/1/1/1/1/2/261/194
MKQSNRKDEIDAARLRLETAKRWAVSASKNLDAARQDDIHARAEVQEAEAFLKSKMKAKKKKKVANACTEIVMHQPETNVKGEIESKWVTTVIVTGCGIPAGSGVYKQCGFCDGVPKYIKNAEKNGPHVAFMIYRCKVREESRKWYISIVAPNIAVCYSARNKGSKPDRSPPTGGWLNISTQDYEPSLKVIHGF